MTLFELFRVLSSFQPPRADLSAAPWDDYVEWAISQGLAPLAAYNLEFRLGGAGAPDWARDRLLSIYQGSLNDNVMKLVNFKRTVDALEGRRILLLGGGGFAEALYPHVGFRPVIDVHLLLRPLDVDPFAAFLGGNDFKVEPAREGEGGARRVLTDGRTFISLHAELLGPARAAEERALFDRALPMKVYGPSVYRPDLEDAILLEALDHARTGYDVPVLSFIDLRELLLGAPSMGGAYSRPVDFGALIQRAHAWRVDRALYTSASIVEALFPEAAEAARRAKPRIAAATAALLRKAVIAPITGLGKRRELRGADRLRKLLAGGG